MASAANPAKKNPHQLLPFNSNTPLFSACVNLATLKWSTTVPLEGESSAYKVGRLSDHFFFIWKPKHPAEKRDNGWNLGKTGKTSEMQYKIYTASDPDAVESWVVLTEIKRKAIIERTISGTKVTDTSIEYEYIIRGHEITAENLRKECIQAKESDDEKEDDESDISAPGGVQGKIS